MPAPSATLLEAPGAGPVFHPSWPPAVRELLTRAIARHGGWALWRRLESISVRPLQLRGFLPWMKGHPRRFALPGSITTYPKRARTEFADYPRPGHTGIFADGDVRLCDPTGALTAASVDHRRTFRGLHKHRRWSPLDALYFFGYAFASYGAFPFVLPALRFHKVRTSGAGPGQMSCVELELPAGAHVHSRRQRFYFDETGLLRRNDYVADIVGWVARGAHRWEAYTETSGLPIPLRRIVTPQMGGLALPFPIVLDARFADATVVLS